MVSGDRLRQIKGWLQTRLSLAEAREHYVAFEKATLQLLGRTGGWVAHFEEELLSQFQPGDEFWLYDAGADAWVHMHGEKGMALVREGEVVAFILEGRN
jgi:hypothetical protein